jgi:hypothetical protein
MVGVGKQLKLEQELEIKWGDLDFWVLGEKY